jgi:hypothetical protein
MALMTRVIISIVLDMMMGAVISCVERGKAVSITTLSW